MADTLNFHGGRKNYIENARFLSNIRKSFGIGFEVAERLSCAECAKSRVRTYCGIVRYFRVSMDGQVNRTKFHFDSMKTTRSKFTSNMSTLM